MHRTKVSLVVVAIVGLSPHLVFAQRAGKAEIQVGAGYIYDPGFGPSTAALNLGGIVWLTHSVGLGGYLVAGLGDNHYKPPQVSSDRTFLGPGSARQSSLTLQGRSIADRNELDFGIGISRLSYENQTVLTAVRRGTGELEPIAPRLIREHPAQNAFHGQILMGREITKVLSLKAGIMFDLILGAHPIQPVVFLSRKFGR